MANAWLDTNITELLSVATHDLVRMHLGVVEVAIHAGYRIAVRCPREGRAGRAGPRWVSPARGKAHVLVLSVVDDVRLRRPERFRPRVAHDGDAAAGADQLLFGTELDHDVVGESREVERVVS